MSVTVAGIAHGPLKRRRRLYTFGRTFNTFYSIVPYRASLPPVSWVARANAIERRMLPLSSTTTLVGGRIFALEAINCNSIVLRPDVRRTKLTQNGAHTRSVQER